MGTRASTGECSESVLNITQESVSAWLYTPTDTVFITIVLPILAIVGLVFTLTFLFVVYRVPKVRSDTTVYLIHLAFSDTLFICAQVYFFLTRYTGSPLRFDSSLENSTQCSVSTLFIVTSYIASIALVTTMSHERYLALCHPIQHLKIRGRRRTLKRVAVCWLVALIGALLQVPDNAVLVTRCFQWPNQEEYRDLPSYATYCEAVHRWVHYYNRLLVTFPFFVSMFGNIYMYARIIHMLNQRTSVDGIARADKKARQVRNQVAKMLIVNGLVFFICSAPYIAMMLTEWICGLARITNPFLNILSSNNLWIVSSPQSMSAVVNPLIYGVINAQYRSAFFQAFRRKPRVSQLRRGKAAPSISAAKTFETDSV